MELLTTNVMDTTGLDPATAKAAIGHVLLFLRGEAPLGHVSEFIDRVPGAREAVAAAAAELPLCRGCRDAANLLSAGDSLLRKGLAARSLRAGKYFWRAGNG